MPRVRALAALLSSCVLAGALALPLVDLVLASDEVPLCGRGGRCCCRTGDPGADGRPCVASACRCGGGEPIATAASLIPDALLVTVVRLPAGVPATLRWPNRIVRRLCRSLDPPTPPPRSLRSA